MIGSTISHYKILEKLGEGGMGVVYKAHDTKLNRDVAIKFLPAHVSKAGVERERFLQEAQAAASINHPNICVIHEINDDADQPYIVMEYVDGSTIRTKLENGPFTVDEAIRYGIQIGEALQEAHNKGIVHRDIKADNVIINSKGQAKVMDFGLAKLKGTLKLTKTSSTVGTLGYMSPEQIQGKEADARSDIFAFGVLLFEMLTGKLPFRGEHEAAMVYSIVNEDPEPIQKYIPEISGEIVHTLGKALEKNPDDRYQTIQDLVGDLRRAKKDTSRVNRVQSANQKDIHREDSAGKKKSLLSKNGVWIGAGTFAVALLGAILYYIFGVRSSAPLPPMQIIRLTTYPGQERDPALSPNGKSIAFSWNGDHQDNFDIYVKLVDAGVPVRLTTNPLVDCRPAWSPDGSFIAFVRDYGTRQVPPKEIYIIPSIGGKEQKIIGFHPGLNEQPSISWSHDGKSIYFTNWSAKDSGFVIFKVAIETKDVEQITHLPQSTWGDQSPSVSPDGRYIAFVRRTLPEEGDLCLQNLSDNSFRQMTNLKTWIDGFSWCADSRSIVFSSNIDGSSSLWRANISSSGLIKTMSGLNITNPNISLEGNRLVYAETIENNNIWKLDLRDPKKETEIISSSTFDNLSPDISSDGKKILFTSNRTGSVNIWMCESDGTNQTPLTSFVNSGFGFAKWSPDGTEILMDFDKGTYLLNTSGGTPKQIRRLTFPIWSEDGNGFYASEYPENVLYKYSKDGEIQKPITNGHGIMPKISGEYIYFIRDWDHHDIWRIPIKGGEEEPVLVGVPDLSIGQWAVEKDGIYFIRLNEGSPFLDFYNFTTKHISHIKELSGTATKNFTNIAIAPDGSYLLYSRREPTKSDIILVENFK
jgi:eukaryotic-like serine/threonine-protein kinase